MKTLTIICQTMILYGLYMTGEFVQSMLQLSIPGSIIGMLLLFTLLHFKWFQPKWIETGSHFLIKHMPLLFIPATVGAMDYLSLFQKHPASIGVVLISTFIVMILSSVISQKLNNKKTHESLSDGKQEMSI
ncbi:holin-like protein [Peribacillus deserti]|uniref:Holin-like protein n=1 Tax=Peribacillus deserti TaxID=673318 RepID=A0ABS2QLM5_9BACI|nr:CidA/LrgA family protein [Peribacillus deserti]MBM7693865.1 holin-like protein [Peribacillus deserti]